MAHVSIDGMVTVAKLKRGLLGGAVYKDVTIRKDDGDTRRLGTIMVSNDMKHALVPGARGRFYAYDVLGSKGVYGFRPACGRAHGRFPFRWEIMGYGLGVANLLVVLSWIILSAKMPFLTTALFIAMTGMGVLFTVNRLAAMRAYRADEVSVPSRADLRAASARA